MENTLKVLNLTSEEEFTIPTDKVWYNQGTGDISIGGQTFYGPFWGAFHEFDGDLQPGESYMPPVNPVNPPVEPIAPNTAYVRSVVDGKLYLPNTGGSYIYISKEDVDIRSIDVSLDDTAIITTVDLNPTSNFAEYGAVITLQHLSTGTINYMDLIYENGASTRLGPLDIVTVTPSQSPFLTYTSTTVEAFASVPKNKTPYIEITFDATIYIGSIGPANEVEMILSDVILEGLNIPSVQKGGTGALTTTTFNMKSLGIGNYSVGRHQIGSLEAVLVGNYPSAGDIPLYLTITEEE